MLTFNTRRVAWVLGFLGLIPFLFGAVAVIVGFRIGSVDALGGFIAYSAVILSFLSGSLWSNAEHQGLSRACAFSMILSNAFCLSAWAALLMGNRAAPVMLLMVAFPLLLIAERRLKDSLHPSYMRLRSYLTWIVVAVHVVVLLALV